MSDQMLIMIAALPPTVFALATFQLVKRSKTTLDQVHVLTNSNLSRVITDLALANDRIKKLEELITRDADHEAVPPDLRNKKV